MSVGGSRPNIYPRSLLRLRLAHLTVPCYLALMQGVLPSGLPGVSMQKIVGFQYAGPPTLTANPESALQRQVATLPSTLSEASSVMLFGSALLWTFGRLRKRLTPEFQRQQSNLLGYVPPPWLSR